LLRYTLRRLLGAVPTLFLVIVLAFLLVHAAPGGPFDDQRALPPEIERNIAAAYHLDESLPRQFLRYLSGVIRGDFGPSYSYRDYTVSELIGRSFPVSLQLGALAMLLAVVIGIGAGTVAALRKHTAVDKLVMGFAMTGISIPVFVVAPVLVLLLAVHLQWLPASWTGGEGWSRLLLPVISLALPQIAYVARLSRASLIDVMASDFIRTARAQGLGTVLSYLGPAVAAVLTGSVVVEQIFGIPGLGQLFVRGSLNRDYTLVLGVVIFYASLIVLFNLVVDLLYGVIDPRIRHR
jgi:oligopeptide transport system permease protein